MAGIRKFLGELVISSEFITKERNVSARYFNPVQNKSIFVKRFAAKTTDKDGRVEALQGIKMPGFIPPDRIREEGYFTQKAREELEKFKRKMDKDKLGPPKNEES